jgi:hypothetical protein
LDELIPVERQLHPDSVEIGTVFEHGQSKLAQNVIEATDQA